MGIGNWGLGPFLNPKPQRILFYELIINNIKYSCKIFKCKYI